MAEDSDSSNNVMDKSDEEDPMVGNGNDEDEEPPISSFQATSSLHELRRYSRSVRLR